ncbi:hypothetical protein [Oribacterium sp. P6A1]|uniref:hypothetical protein n=1 Tax=Oribacterium sp. P6A1 TaxID=1410612 RepID=UPI00056AFB1B|nr:hypothetical protein [Oribacterium sp. P6A1]
MKTSSNKKTPLWHDWLTYDLIFGITLQIIVFLVAVFVWHMGYPKLTFEKAAVLNMLYLTLFLPFFVGVLGLWARTNELPVWVRFFTALSLPVLILGITASVILCFISPYCSSTENVKHYMVMDQNIDPDAELISRHIFPERIPGNASNITYRYYKYSSILEDSFHLSLGEVLPDETYEAECERILNLSDLRDAEISSSSDITLIDKKINDKLIVHITLDNAYNRIIYSAGCNEYHS